MCTWYTTNLLYKLVVYQIPNLQVPYHYLILVHLRRGAVVIWPAQKVPIRGISSWALDMHNVASIAHTAQSRQRDTTVESCRSNTAVHDHPSRRTQLANANTQPPHSTDRFSASDTEPPHSDTDTSHHKNIRHATFTDQPTVCRHRHTAFRQRHTIPQGQPTRHIQMRSQAPQLHLTHPKHANPSAKIFVFYFIFLERIVFL